MRKNTAPADLSRFPDFLIIGPQRTGTTWLYHNLKTHPQIFLPHIKETYYFSTLGQPDHPRYRFPSLDSYLELMQDSPRRFAKKTYDALRNHGEFYRPSMRGEATATYAKLPVSTISEITGINPGIKAILMLRHPVERALSHAKKDLLRNRGRSATEVSPGEFAAFFRGKGQLQMASYSDIIGRWESCLEPGNLLLGDFSAISDSPSRLLSEIHDFLGVRASAGYHGKHLREQINSTSGVSAPSESVELLHELLADQVADFERIVAQRFGDQSGLELPA